MGNSTIRTLAVCGVSVLVGLAAAHAQRQVAAPVTDQADPKFITPQTRKMGGPMPAEQMALTFDHLDLALKVPIPGPVTSRRSSGPHRAS